MKRSEVRSEIVAPLNQTVGLVDDKQVDPVICVQPVQPRPAVVRLKTLWSDQHILVAAHKRHSISKARLSRLGAPMIAKRQGSFGAARQLGHILNEAYISTSAFKCLQHVGVGGRDKASCERHMIVF